MILYNLEINEETKTTRAERLPVKQRDRHVCVFLGGESDWDDERVRNSETRNMPRTPNSKSNGSPLPLEKKKKGHHVNSTLTDDVSL